MTLKVWVGGALGACALVALGLEFIGRGNVKEAVPQRDVVRAGQVANGPGANAPGMEVKMELSAMRAELAQLRAERSVGAEPTSIGIAKAPPLDPSELQARTQERMAEIVLLLSNRFDSEPTERGWAREVESQVVDVLGSSAPGSRLVEADCRTSMCRLTLQHDSPEVKRGLATAVTGKPPFDGPVLYVPSEPGATQSTLFVGRVGASLL